MKSDCELGYINATDLADYLVVKGVTFRTAHYIVGKLVHYAENEGLKLNEISIERFKQESLLIENDIYEFIDVKACLMRRQTYGSPGWFIESKAHKMDIESNMESKNL
ncbi:hypothetical protein R2F61_02320 [Mollicutes bacterium LVI A0078]|nr:hypothetical protein RZE84_02350 [Mollicutes bacterium LVI A0075]WOO91404.1 hypothetical protein R2F61_02320 [Mollicutes bacterium LVI A0078]